MRAEHLQVELYPRSPWEAMELGGALVRRHARAIWLPWLTLSVPMFVLLNALGVWLGMAGAASLLLWWLKPVFDRIPLFVLSRAVFGEAPRVRDTLAAQWHWGWRAMPAYLLWRRLGPARALYLPVDVLEGGAAGPRRRVIGGSVRGTAALLTLVCVNFELVLTVGTFALALLFVPVDYLSESAKAAWTLLSQDPPPWLWVVINAVIWLASSVIEPFYVGAGFGMYLDRRTRLEAWDVEIGLRRLRTRLRTTVATLAALVCAGVLAMATPAPARAAAPAAPATQANTLVNVFPHIEQDPAFAQAVQHTEQDPLLHPVRKQTAWVPIQKDKPKPKPAQNPVLAAIAKGFGLIGEWGLWIALALLLGLLLKTHRYWWPWLQGVARPLPAPLAAASSQVHSEVEVLPADIVGSVRALWQEGRRRRALALLYRASVEAMVQRTGAVLVPGATEADCLRAARGLPDPADRDAFAGMVRVWQYAAYAERLPDTETLDTLLQRLAARFGWAA